VESLDLASVMVTFLALVGPQKVLLSFAEVAQRLETRVARRVAVAASIAAAAIGALCAWTAPWLAGFFHVGVESMELEGGLVLFIYAVCLVLGVHLGADPDGEDGEIKAAQPAVSGFRQLLLPFVVSPLGVTAVLVDALSGSSWGWRSTTAGAYAAVVAINLGCMLALAPLMRRAQTTVLEVVLEVLSRLLGLLLAAVAVELFLEGLAGLGVLHR
jgi:multiple antibiotic resistance protein